MKKYECTTCGALTTERQHLCQAREVAEDRTCGVDQDKVNAMCTPMQQQGLFTCGFCGRPSDQPELLCNPTQPGPE